MVVRSAGRALVQLVVLGLSLAPAGRAQAASVGIHAADVTPSIGVPLAGYFDRRRVIPDWLGLDPYAHWFEPSTGVRPGDGIRAKALVIETATNPPKRLVLVSLDVVAVTRGLRRAILRQLDLLTASGLPAFAPDEVVVAATHTHSGPGTLTRNYLLERIGSDRFERTVRDAFAARVALVVKAAWSQRVPATLHAFSVAVPGVVRNRSDPPGPLHERANVMLVRAGSRWAGALVNFAVHGTALGPDNLEFSADLPGAIERRLEKELTQRNGDGLPTVVAFLNGAEGDVSPKLTGEPGLLLLPELVAWPVHQAIDAMGCGAVGSCTSWLVDADRVKTRQARLPLREAFVYWKHHVPDAYSALVWWRFGGWLGWTLWDDTRIAQVEIGDQLLLTWPGEATTRLGRALARVACAHGARLPWIVGLANDHLSYFTTEDEFFGGHGIAQSSALYGPYAGRRILNAHCQLLATP